MAYLAIARKYRPATFDGIVGQEHVTRTLKNALAKGRVHHAFLFCGARGVGKTTAARALARALNCVEGPTAEPCGVCTSCVEINAGTNPDLIEIDGASNNSVDDIRELREAVRYAPTAGRWKIYLIDEVHMLSRAAFNALLKTLEEPPPHVVFIFATTEPNKIPDTILSRVQRFDFKRIPVPGVVARLREIAAAEGTELSDNGLRMIARAGEGSMRDAQSLLDKVISFGGSSITDEEVAETLGLIDRGLLYQMLEGLVRGEPALCLDAIESVYSFGFELSQFTGEMLEVLRNATFVRLSPEARKHVDLSADELSRLDALLEGVPAEALTRHFTVLLEVHDQVSRASRPRIVLEMAVARLATTRPVQPVVELVNRLHELEHRLRHGGAPARARPLRSTAKGSTAAPGAKGRTQPKRPTPPKGPMNSVIAAQPEMPPQPKPKPKPTPTPAPRAEAPKPKPKAPPQPVAQPNPARNQAGATAPPAPAIPHPDELTDADRWRGLSAALEQLGAKRLMAGTPTLREGVVSIEVDRGLPAAEARREAKRDEVLAAVKTHYGERTLEVTEPVRNAAEAAERIAIHDPALKRIVDALSAEVSKINPIKE